MIDVSVVIVNYNVKDYLEQTLRSLERAASGLSTEIFVVDNNSSDGSEKLFESDFPNVRYIRNSENVGFARANNQALRLATGRYVLVLNPDTILQEDTLQAMMDFMAEHPEAGAIGCRILNADGSLQLACRRSFPTPGVAFFKLIGLSRLFPRSRLFGRYNLTYLNPDQVHQVDAISGAFMFLRRDIIEKVGMLDEDFFMFGEDLDWCYRIKQAGWGIYYVPTTQIVHYKGESIRRSGINSLFTFYQAMYIFVRKHMKTRYLFPLQWLITIGILLKACLTLLGRVVPLVLAPVMDLVLVNGAITLAIIARFGSLIPLPPHYSFKSYLIIHGVCSAIWMLTFLILGLYGRKRYSVSRAFTAAVVGALVIGSIYLFQFEAYGFSRRALAYASILTAIFMPGWRVLLRLVSKKTLGRGLVRRRTVVVGTDQSGRNLLDRLRRHPRVGYDVVGLVNGNRDRVGEMIDGVEILGTVEDLPEIVRSRAVEEVVLSTASMPYQQTLQLISSFREPRIHVKLAPSPLDVMIGRRSIESLESVPLVDISDAAPGTWQKLTKRTFDCTLGGLGLILFSPVLCVQMLLAGGGGRRFRFQSIDESGNGGSKTGLMIFSDGDRGQKAPSPLVRAMSRFRLDRVQWLWPVVRGKLSLVGSPLSGSASDGAASAIGKRINPGLTGLVQLEGEAVGNEEERMKYELYYLRNQSVLLDGEIVLRSLWRLITSPKETDS